MKFVNCALCIFSIGSLAFALDITVPKRFQRYLDHDQNNNVAMAEKLLGPMKENDKRLVPVYHFDVPLDKAGVLGTLSQTALSGNPIVNSAEGTIRIFIKSPFTVEADRLKQLAPMQQKYFMTKVLSNNTYLVFESADNGAGAFIKFSSTDTINDALVTNNSARKILEAQKLLRGQKGNDVVTLIDEPQVRKAAGIVNILRDADFISDVPKGEAVFPLHGFFGKELELVAKRKGISKEEWLREVYAPKLAKAIATLNWKYGVYGCLHTQNLLIQVNEESGEITKFLVRDIRDTVFDADVLHRNKVDGDLILHDAYKLHTGRVPLLYDYRVLNWDNTPTIENSGYIGARENMDGPSITSFYALSEAIQWVASNGNEKEKLTQAFLKQYAKTAAEVTNTKEATLPPYQSTLLPGIDALRTIDETIRSQLFQADPSKILANQDQAQMLFRGPASSHQREVLTPEGLKQGPVFITYENGMLTEIQLQENGRWKRLRSNILSQKTHKMLFDSTFLGSPDKPGIQYMRPSEVYRKIGYRCRAFRASISEFFLSL